MDANPPSANRGAPESFAFALLDGLEYVHEEGLLHRDISHENIMVTDRGRPVLMDFGSARAVLGTNRKLTSVESWVLANAKSNLVFNPSIHPAIFAEAMESLPAALGLTLLFLARKVDLSIMAIGGLTEAIFVKGTQWGWDPAVSLALGLICGFINGAIVGYFNSPEHLGNDCEVFRGILVPNNVEIRLLNNRNRIIRLWRRRVLPSLASATPAISKKQGG